MGDYTIKDGDCLSSVAADNSIADYHTLYDDPSNKNIKATRPNPNTLAVGDSISLPQKGKAKSPVQSTTTKTFVIASKKPVRLRIELVDHRDVAPADRDWTLTAGQALSGTIVKDKGALLVLEIKPGTKSGTLKLSTKKTPASPAAAKPALAAITKPSPEKYPPDLKAEDYLDEEEEAFTGKAGVDDGVEWDLKIGSLPPFDTDPGVQTRLQNLGFKANNDDTTAGDAATQAIKRFQRRNKLQPTGVAKDVHTKLRAKHDDP